MEHVFGFPYIIFALIIGVVYLVSSLAFLRVDRSISATAQDKMKLVSFSPADTFLAIRRIWTAQYSLRTEPKLAVLMVISRVCFLLYTVMIVTFIWFVIWGDRLS